MVLVLEPPLTPSDFDVEKPRRSWGAKEHVLEEAGCTSDRLCGIEELEMVVGNVRRLDLLLPPLLVQVLTLLE